MLLLLIELIHLFDIPATVLPPSSSPIPSLHPLPPPIFSSVFYVESELSHIINKLKAVCFETVAPTDTITITYLHVILFILATTVAYFSYKSGGFVFKSKLFTLVNTEVL